MESLEYNPAITRIEESRGSPYFNQWQWAVSWRQPEISALRNSLDPKEVARLLAHRRQWEKVRRFTPNFSLDTDFCKTSDKNIETVRSWLEHNTIERKLVFNPNQITVYLNDAKVAEELVELAQSVFSSTIKVKQAVIDLPRDTVVLKKPYEYKYRTYFRDRQLSDDARDILLSWINSMGNSVYACPSLMRFLKGARSNWIYRQWTWNHYFIDHNDSKLDVWIAMVCPGVVRKTMSIQVIAK